MVFTYPFMVLYWINQDKTASMQRARLTDVQHLLSPRTQHNALGYPMDVSGIDEIKKTSMATTITMFSNNFTKTAMMIFKMI